MYDIIIIGAGVSGAAIAREISRYGLKVCVLERGADLCAGTSKANSAIIHAGHDAKPGTLKAKFNVEGNAMMDDLARDLDIPFRRNGSLVICTDPENREGLEVLLERGRENGVPGLRIISGDEARAMEPNLSEKVTAALYAPTGGIVCPFELNIAMAENAAMNGVEFFFNADVKDIERDEEGIFSVVCGNVTYQAKCVVNAAGVFADEIHNMVCPDKLHITPRKGEYCLHDKEVGGFVSHTIFQLPTKAGKGILVTPTIHGNLLTGPTSVSIEDKEDTATTAEGLAEVIEKANLSVTKLPMRKVITSFAGLRAHEDGGDFIVGESKSVPGFFDCAGIESPGLTSSPALGVYLAKLLKEKLKAAQKENWIGTRKGILNPTELSIEERNELIRRNPAYGRIICRCESVTEGEILDAIHRPLGARTLDGIKQRTRAGMGRCQAGFCSPKVMEILHRELGLSYEEINKNDSGSYIVAESTRR